MRFRITSPFGSLEEFRDTPHTGTDLSMEIGTPILSPIQGIVERIVNYEGDNIGKGIILRTEEGERLIFGHLSEWKVKVGETISKGQEIALSGNTGNSTGAHLHLGLWEDGQYIDPTHYVNMINGSSIKDFLLQPSPLMEWLKSLGFSMVAGEVFFLIPAVLLFGIRLMCGKNFSSVWILPLLYAYIVTEKL
jgi:murein DD-endopeptidase MepM/ murein hydrolase activator NlpD